MSIDIIIKQKGFFKKEITLDVILGSNLKYGEFANDHLIKDKLGETDFIAYDPEHIGRGFSVVWNPSEKNQIELRLPQPANPEETKSFYDTVERIATYWTSTLIVDGNKTKLSDFLSGYDDMIEFNERVVKRFSYEVLDGTHDNLTLYSAMWPLVLGTKEAKVFANEPSAFFKWLHDMQNIEAFYASADFYQTDDGIKAIYTLRKGLTYIFPKSPTVPFGLTDPRTGKALECSDWNVWITETDAEDEPVAKVEFDQFLNYIPQDKKQDYDEGSYKITV